MTVWLTALRLPFYPMMLLAFAAGASLVQPHFWRAPSFWLGAFVACLVEALTVLVNERFDFESDRRNERAGRFNGGSRVLVTGALAPAQLVRAAWAVAAALLGLAVVALVWRFVVPTAVLWVALGTALGVAYTAPPLALCHRCLGEVTGAVSFSFLTMVGGALSVGGCAGNVHVWLAAVPLFCAILPSIILGAVPDVPADAAAGKRTLAVALGSRGALALAGAAALVTAGLAELWRFSVMPAIYGPATHLAAAHATIVAALLLREAARPPTPRDVDALMALSLALVPWFSLLVLL